MQIATFAMASLGSVSAASAQMTGEPAPREAATEVRIAASPLGTALMRFAAASGVNLSLDPALIQGLQADGLSGQFTVEAGFAALLKDTGLETVRADRGSYVLQRRNTDQSPRPAPRAASIRPTAPRVSELSAVTVTARTQSPVMAPTQPVTVLDRQAIETLRLGSDSIATLISKATPGMADSSHTVTDYGQTLRGRNMLILVDGIPLNTGRDSSRNLANINPADIEEIEILRGSSAIYGSGAPGGVISIRTRRPTGVLRMESTFSANSPLSRLSAAGLGGEMQHYLSGGNDRIDYSFSLGARYTGASFDARGHRIAPEPSQGDLFDSNTINGTGKLGFQLDEDQRLQLSLSYLESRQDSDYASDPSVARLAPGSAPARSIKGLELDRQNQVQNKLVGIDYEHRDLLGSTLAAQIYYRDFYTRFAPFDARAVPVRGANVDQSMQRSEVMGGRLTVKTPFGEGGRTLLIWGSDFNRERSDMPIDVFDPRAYDASGGLVFRKTGRLIYMPPVTTRSVAAFGQFQHTFNERFSAEAGIRFDKAKARFDDFIPLSQSRVAAPQQVKGGSVDYSSTTYNAGLIYTPVKGQEIYASFRQGFELPDIGVVIRNATPAFSISTSSLQAVKTDTFEIGWRGAFDLATASIAVFQSQSDLGAVQSFNNGLSLLRTKEKIHGVEASLDYVDPNSPWSAGASMAWLKGRERPQSASAYQDMTGYRIPPLKLTAYVEYRPTDAWTHRIQATSYSSKDYRLDGRTGFGRYDTQGYTTVDVMTQWAINSNNRVSGGIENLFNRYYYPLYSQLLRNNNNTSHLPAPGASLRITYSHTW